jgi:hypothetical protein
VSPRSRRLRAYMLAKRRQGRVLGRRPRWSAEHAAVFAEQAKRALREDRR